MKRVLITDAAGDIGRRLTTLPKGVDRERRASDIVAAYSLADKFKSGPFCSAEIAADPETSGA